MKFVKCLFKDDCSNLEHTVTVHDYVCESEQYSFRTDTYSYNVTLLSVETYKPSAIRCVCGEYPFKCSKYSSVISGSGLPRCSCWGGPSENEHSVLTIVHMQSTGIGHLWVLLSADSASEDRITVS